MTLEAALAHISQVKAQPTERRFLRVTDFPLPFCLSVGGAHPPSPECHDPFVSSDAARSLVNGALLVLVGPGRLLGSPASGASAFAAARSGFGCAMSDAAFNAVVVLAARRLHRLHEIPH